MNNRIMRHKGRADCEPIQYTACGLDNIYLVSGYERHETKHGVGMSVNDADDLHRAIGHSLVFNQKTLNGNEFRFLRKHMDLTQAKLAEVLGVTSQTVARWEKGETSIDGPAEAVLRLLYMQFIDAMPPEVLRLLQDLAAKDDNPVAKQFFGKRNDTWVQLAAA